MHGNPFDACRVPDCDLEDKRDEHGGHHHGRHEFGATDEPFYDRFYMVPHSLFLWISCRVH